MKILVTVKQVATLDDEFELADSGRDVDPDFLEQELNEVDEYAIEEALLIKERTDDPVEVVAVTVGPESTDEVLRQAVARGADRGIRVWDSAFEGSDAIAVGRILARIVEREDPDLVFTGTQSSDHAFAATGMAMAGFLGWPHVTVITRLDYRPADARTTVHRELEGGLEEIMSIQCPAILGIQLGINQPRYVSLRGLRQARSRDVEELDAGDLELELAMTGESGSSARIRRMLVPERGHAELIEGSPAEQVTRLAEIIRENMGA